MSYRWRQRQRSCRVTVLQVIAALEVLVAVGLMAVGRIPPPGATEGLAILAIFLLALPILVLTWLMFEMRRPDQG